MRYEAPFRRILRRLGARSEEERLLRPYFDAQWYLEEYPDVRGHADPFGHYVEFGLKEGRNPNAAFSSSYYYGAYGDAAISGLPAILHYIKIGVAENRRSHLLFDPSYYARANAEVGSGTALLHYLEFGAAEKKSPHPLFEVDIYVRCFPELGETPDKVLAHFLRLRNFDRCRTHSLFDFSYYLKRYPDIRAAGANPLLHYLEHGWREGRRPHKWFDGQWYLFRRPDVQKARTNPLIHFVLHGAKEGSSPCREFDPAAYLAQLPDSERNRIDNPLLHFLRYGRIRRYRAFPVLRADGDAIIRQFFVSVCSNGKPTILMVLHNHGGGTQHHVEDLAKHIAARANALLLYPSTRDEDVLQLLEPHSGRELEFYGTHEWHDLIRLLKDCGIGRVHIHHTAGLKGRLRRLVRDLGVPFDVTIHDHWMLAPRDLPANDGQPSDEASAANNDKAWIVAAAARVIAPSNDAARRTQQTFPSIRIIVAAHLDRDKGIEPSPPRLALGMPLRIGVLGTLTLEKGLDVVLQCSAVARRSGLPLQFVLVGSGNARTHDLEQSGVEVTGSYPRDAVAGKLAEMGVHALWYPSQVAETYSYTLSEGLASGLPLIVPDFGAFPERVGGRSWVWIEPWDSTPSDWVRLFIKIRQTNFLCGVEPTPSPAQAVGDDTFYHEDYLAWASEGARHD
jgi:glycosyltransferase involved in cell wall biosynthesis